MLRLIPIEDKEKLDRLCEENGVKNNKNVHIYLSPDENIEALCIFTLENYNMEILKVKSDEKDPLIAELLIRSVANYGANRSGYIMRVSEEVGKSIENTLLTLKFKKDKDVYIGKVPKILEGTCHCNKNV